MSPESRPPGAIGAPPCVSVSDLAARKTLGIPKQPRQGLITRTTRTSRAAEIRINSSQAAADAAIANDNRCAANKQAAGWMAAAGLPEQARLAFQGRADASLDELLPRCTIKRRAEDFVVDEIDEDGQRASEAMTRAPEATLRAALDDLAAKLDSRQQQPAADVDESDGEDALATLDEATLDALRAFDGAAKDRVLRDGVGASPISVALPDGGNRQNLRLALEKGFPWTRVRLESGAVLCGIKILRRVRAESSRRPPRHRRDACSMAWRCRFLTVRPS